MKDGRGGEKEEGEEGRRRGGMEDGDKERGGERIKREGKRRAGGKEINPNNHQKKIFFQSQTEIIT